MPRQKPKATYNREELVDRLLKKDSKFRSLHKSHQKLKDKLEEIDRRPHLSNQEEMERKKIQKMKLNAKDRMEAILNSIR